MNLKKSEIPKARVLIVDDDKNTRDGLHRALRSSYQVLVADNGATALDILRSEDVDILLSDIRMPGMDGLTLLQRALATQPDLICVLLTAYGNVETAVEAMKRGAFDFLMKPVNLDHLDLLLQRAMRTMQVERENADLKAQLNDKFGLENFIGNSHAMEQVFDLIQQAAPTQASVLIQGESGTGKELVAHALHTLSTRAKGPFVAVHCASLSDQLLESELFGHEKGAFTGAMARRKGRFEMADGGSLFLDEISEIDPSVQVKLLRVLEERRFERVGGDEPVDVDIRLIAATNRNLKQLVADGNFREDLYFRLDVITVDIPPLRDRGDDVALLASRFIHEFSEKNGKAVDGITADAMSMLAAYSWPGNVRELRNTIEKMVVLTRGERLTARDIPPSLRSEVGGGSVNAPRRSGMIAAPDSLADAERAMIYRALEKHGDNRTKAAEELGISRRTLHRKLRQYNEDVLESTGDDGPGSAGEGGAVS